MITLSRPTTTGRSGPGVTARLLVVPYAALRVPLAALDRTLVQNLPAHCRRRTVFDHGLGVADHWVGLIIGDEDIADNGRLRIESAGHFTASPGNLTPARGTYAIKRYASVRPAIGQTLDAGLLT